MTMINDNSFEDRLNAIKSGEDVPQMTNPEYKWAPQIPEQKTKISLTQKLLIDIYQSFGKISGVLIASLLYGYGIAAILSMDWGWIQTLGVGFLFNHTLTTFPKAIKNLFTKSRV